MTEDSVDQRILALLRENARASTAELGRKLGLSRTTVHSRIERLLKRGVIAGFTVRVSPERERGQVQAMVMITVAPKFLARVETGLRALPEVRRLYSVSGQQEFIAMVTAESVAEMDRLLDRIGALEGVDRTVSSIVLSTRIER